MRDPLISVIVPVYKVEKFLDRCVESIQNQTHRNLEIILVDDGSPDRCGQMCDELALGDPRIRVVHKKNGGLSSARNAGLDIMTGEYVGFVDSDDWIEPSMYQTLLARMTGEDAQISCCGIARCDGNTVQSYFNPALDEKFTMDREDAMLEWIANARITNSMCDKLYRAEIFSGLRMKEGILYEDMQVQPYCIHRAARVTYTAEPLYNYYLSEGSILRGEFSTRHYDCILASLERIAFLEKNYPNAHQAAKAMHLVLCLNQIYQSSGNEKWTELRQKMIDTVRQPTPKEILRMMPRNSRIKRVLLCIHERLFRAVMDIYSAGKK